MSSILLGNRRVDSYCMPPVALSSKNDAPSDHNCGWQFAAKILLPSENSATHNNVKEIELLVLYTV